ncbi:MAG: hypothetical protein EPO32_02245 [Anaerolineae bacterium]|nr:MAG: hypothetical protein EPO32_02245 [Anaerolineae bacterium]
MKKLKISPAKILEYSAKQLVVEKTRLTATPTNVNLYFPLAIGMLFFISGVINSNSQNILIGVISGLVGIVAITTVPVSATFKVSTKEDVMVFARSFLWRRDESKNIDPSEISEIELVQETYPNLRLETIRVRTFSGTFVELRFVDNSDDSKRAMEFFKAAVSSNREGRSNVVAVNRIFARNDIESKGLLPLHLYLLSLGIWTDTVLVFLGNYFPSAGLSSGFLIAFSMGFVSTLMENQDTRIPLGKIACAASVICYFLLAAAEYYFKDSLILLTIPSIVSLGLAMVVSSHLPSRYQLDMLRSQPYLLDKSQIFRHTLLFLLALLVFMVVQFSVA